jgi:acetyltransferase-like isoleucine patch superfamily enzyme
VQRYTGCEYLYLRDERGEGVRSLGWHIESRHGSGILAAQSIVCARMNQVELAQRLRIFWYRRQWTCADVVGAPRLVVPTVIAGAGRVRFAPEVTIGWRHSPDFLSGYTYIEARHPNSTVELGERTHLNNGTVLISDGPGILIGQRCLIGPGVHMYDSDFHALDPDKRHTHEPLRALVVIEDDVFIGSSAIILKGVRVGAGSVVGAGAVVTSDVLPGQTVVGNPARAVRA